LLTIRVFYALFCVACLCYEKLDNRRRANFLKDCVNDSAKKCLFPCPYDCVRIYYDMCPDKSGSMRILEIENGVSKDHLSFMRAKTTQGFERHFTEGCLGVNSLRNIVKRVNRKLPEDLMVDRPTVEEKVLLQMLLMLEFLIHWWLKVLSIKM